MKYKEYTEKQYERVLQLCELDYSYRKISKMTGVSAAVASNWCRGKSIPKFLWLESKEIPESVRILRSRFSDMKKRCYNKNFKAYKNYGGRGIYICKKWLEDSKAFVKWSLKNGFHPNLELDRIDNKGPYSPDNCRWTTKNVQGLNRRDTVTDLINKTRICSRCKEKKSLFDFHRSSKPDDLGYQRWCKECKREYSRERRNA